MNTTETKLITDLSEQLKSLPSSAKDADADAMISQTISSQPDAVYKLVQIILIQNMAIEQLKDQMKNLQEKLSSQTSQPAAPKGFLDDLKEKLFGNTNSNSTSNTTQNLNRTPQLNSTNMNNAFQPQASAGSSFLHQAMSVGAGVAGGMLLGNALESLFSSHTSNGNLNQFSDLTNHTDINNFNDNFSNSKSDPTTENLTIDGNDDNNFDSSDNFEGYDDNIDSFDDNSGGDW